MNKRTVRGREKFLARWKGYTAEEDTWESRENLKNAKELVEEFERVYKKEDEELRRQEQEEEEEEFCQELPREFTAKLLYGWGKRRYEREREKKWDENWYRHINQWTIKNGYPLPVVRTSSRKRFPTHLNTQTKTSKHTME